MGRKIVKPLEEEDLVFCSVIYNPLSAHPYEVQISEERYRDSEDAFKTKEGAFAYLSYLLHLKKDRKDKVTGDRLWIDDTANPIATEAEYDAHRMFLKSLLTG